MRNKLMACIGLFGLLVGAYMAPAAAAQSVGFHIDTPTELHETFSNSQTAVKAVESESVDGVIDIGPSVFGAMAMATAIDTFQSTLAVDRAQGIASDCDHYTCPSREPGWRA